MKLSRLVSIMLNRPDADPIQTAPTRHRRSEKVGRTLNGNDLRARTE
jgi:hypothetical protein